MTLLDGVLFIWFLVGSIIMMVMAVVKKDHDERD